MRTWIRIEDGIVRQVMVCVDRPAGDEHWVEYPYPCDLAGAGSRGALNIAGMAIADFDMNGNLPPEES